MSLIMWKITCNVRLIVLETQVQPTLEAQICNISLQQQKIN